MILSSFYQCHSNFPEWETMELFPFDLSHGSNNVSVLTQIKHMKKKMSFNKHRKQSNAQHITINNS